MIDMRGVTKLITHDSCADGLASAMIIRDALPGVEVVFAQYGAPSLEELAPSSGLLFCDITPPRERAAEFVEAGAIVLDHHKHARDIVELFGERGVFADEAARPGVSGAVLAYDQVWMPIASEGHGFTVSEFARLVGVRDTWQTKSPSWEMANDLHAVLTRMPRAYWLGKDAIWRALTNDMLELGKFWREKTAETVAKIGFDGTLSLIDPTGRQWAAFPDSHAHTSDVAEALRGRGVAVTCGWFQTVVEGHLQTVLSLRSDGSLDVGALCKSFGGGGHSRAAGCKVSVSDPLVAVRRVMEAA
jgi:oligoribonuclease NrnB/cAMP/cGMP phosphodiesterase (DHH superfamily)